MVAGLELVEVYAFVALLVTIVSLWFAPYTSLKGRVALALLGGTIWPVYFGAMAYYAVRLPRLPNLCRSCYRCAAKLRVCRAAGHPTATFCPYCSDRLRTG